jgi:outer membrane lipoprotein-sorting protein
MFKSTSTKVLIVLAITLCSAYAYAEDPPATEILDKMDRSMNGYADQQMDVTMVIVDVDGTKKSYDFTIYQKGDVKRYILFTSGEIKGMATLIEDRERVYAYLPGFKKVRRVATHNMNQSFAGSDFTNNDMATVSWTKNYDAKMDHADADSWYLLCTPKPGTQSDYSKAIVKVDKKTFSQMGVDYYDAKGAKVKMFANYDLKDYHGVVRTSLVTLSDPRTGHKTELHVKDFKVNQGLNDDLFTVRQMQWGK